MKRSRIIWQSALLGTLGVVLSLGLTAYLAWSLVINHTQHRLETLADVASQRADATLREASAALKSLATNDFAPCTPEGIARMRLLAINTFSVKSVGYVEEDLFACSSWGPIGHKVEPWAEDFTTTEGVRVSVSVQPRVAPSKPMMALQYAAFNVLVDPEQFLEVVLDRGITLAIGTTDGRLVGTSNHGMERFITLVHDNDHARLTQGYLYTAVAHGDLIAVAAVSRAELLRNLRREELLLLPVGLLLAALVLTVVIRHARQRLSPLAELEEAVRERQITVHYQPILDLHDGRCIGAEALARWQRPDGTLVPPAHFIPLAERSGLILPITDQVIAAIMRDLGPALARDRSLHISFNLAPADVESGRFLPVLRSRMKQAGVLAQQIWLEATESGMVNIEQARATLEAARADGHIIAIDDFGTGYSSLQHLQQLPLDVLKIDKSFTERVGGDGAQCPVIEQIIEMAGKLGLQVVAEGVERAEQVQFLQQRRVSYGQGWFYAKAMPASEFLRFYRQHAPALAPTAEKWWPVPQ